VRLALFADGWVGKQVLAYLQENFPDDLHLIYLLDETQSLVNDRHHSDLLCGHLSDSVVVQAIQERGIELIVLAWWPRIVSKRVFSSSRLGCINFHPSLLPYNRGKHYNFWTIVEGTPFGVTLHFVDSGIDTGAIAYQRRVEKTWLDTGESLFLRARSAMVDLFKDEYQNIRTGNIPKIAQDDEIATMHYARELDAASELFLDKCYCVQDVVNLIRARTFFPHPSSYFYYNGQKVCVRSSISLSGDEGVHYRPLDLTQVMPCRDLLAYTDANKTTNFVFWDDEKHYVQLDFTTDSDRKG